LKRRRLFALAWVFALAPSLSSPADPSLQPAPSTTEWPQWRGPARDGIALDTGLLKSWPEAGPALLWKANGLGEGYSSVAIAGGKVFTLGDKEGAQRLIALDLETRRELWTAKVGRTWGDGGPRSTPTVSGGLVYAIGTHGDLVCVEVDSGKERWRKSLTEDFGGSMMSGWGYSESPLVDGDKLIATPGAKDATLVALDRESGELLWKAKVPDLGPRGNDGAAYSSVVAAEIAGVRQYVQLLGRGVVGVAAEDGRFLWGYNRVANGTANVPTPVVKGDLVFATTSYGTGSALLRIVKDERASTSASSGASGFRAEEVYFLKPKDFENHHGGVILVGGHVYGGDGQNQGHPTCIELESGKVVWKERGPGSGSAAIAYADGHLYFRYENGLVALIEATPEGFRVKGKLKIPEQKGPSWQHPVIAGGRLYLRNQDELLCYGLSAW
jgi:outer membrane protein assembly factor BamB